MIGCTIRVPLQKLKQLQEIVMACNGRFKCNPDINERNNTAFVSLSFSDGANGNEFYKRWHLITTDVVEKRHKVSLIKKIIRFIRG